MFKYIYIYIYDSCLKVCYIQLFKGIRMHACLLKAKKILEVGVQGSKLSIYTYLHITAYMITEKSQKSCLLNKAKARKECNAIIPPKTTKLKYNKGDGHLYKPLHRYG